MLTSIQGIPESALREEQSTQAGSRQPQSAASPPLPAGTATAGNEEGGINLFEAAAQADQGGRGSARSAPSNPGAGAPSAAAANSLDFLRNNPQFQQLRQVVQQQPQMLEPILQQVGAGNPQLAQLIAQNPEQFLQLLAEDADEDAALPPGAQAISVTEEEREAIERVSSPLVYVV